MLTIKFGFCRHAQSSRLTRLLIAAIIGLFLTTLHAPAGETQWPVIPAEELTCQASPLEDEAPAEILEHKIEIIDNDFNERRKTEYRRCKIYAPAKAETLARLNLPTTDNSDLTVSIRLTLPDGTTKEFSDGDMKERTIEKGSSTSYTRKQKFFAVPGVLPGSIIEYKIAETISFYQANSIINEYDLQEDDLPVRHYDFTCHYASSTDYFFQYFLYSAPTAVVTDDPKTRTLHVVVANLPAIHTTQFVGPRTDYVATLCTAYDSPQASLYKSKDSRAPNFHMASNNTPWGSIATGFYAIEYIHTEETRRVSKLAATLCEGATSDLEKARRIHKKVQELYIKFIQSPHSHNPDFLRNLSKGDTILAPNPDATLDFEKEGGPFISDMDFLWLAVALYRSAGLETRTVLLPDRSFVRFDPAKVAPMFLHQICVALRLDGKWQFSYPLPSGSAYIDLDYFAAMTYQRSKYRVMLPFGMLPDNLEGQIGLFVQPNKEEFIPIPCLSADKNLVANVGTFKLDSEGQLTGQAMIRLTGHKALALRAELLNEKPERRTAIAMKRLHSTFKGPEIEVQKIAGIDDPDLPLEISCTIEWPGFATFTKDRMIIKPEVFRAENTSPFTAAKRTYPINFHQLWQEIDRVIIQVPPEYKPETTDSPPSQPGKPFHYRIKYAYDASRHLFGVTREFSSEVIELPVENYPQIKKWYDIVTASDRQEMVFVKNEPALTPNISEFSTTGKPNAPTTESK